LDGLTSGPKARFIPTRCEASDSGPANDRGLKVRRIAAADARTNRMNLSPLGRLSMPISYKCTFTVIVCDCGATVPELGVAVILKA
jgi:hypothetical protein